MKLEEVIEQYVEVKQEPSDMNGLLDFIQHLYVSGIIAIKEYRSFLHAVSSLGARKPEYFLEEQILK